LISAAYILVSALMVFFRYSTPSVCRTVLEKRSIFWDIMSCRPVKINRWLGETCSPISSATKMKATCSSETPVDFRWTTWRYIV
jgi:hypothetical protein